MTSLQPPEVTRWCMLVVSLVCFLVAMAMVMVVVDAERTGVARYSNTPGRSYAGYERVTRAHEPAKFNEAIGVYAFQAFIPGSVAVAAFWFYRRLST
ncbi:MAG: hypothetical protein P4L99_23005 [Chthoniobacter sp.]|nr:hypothetical protein [Chthoniobacter sp.]